MNIVLVTPAPATSRKGNRITALRWKRILQSLGHRVAIRQRFTGGRPDLLVALHARRSFDSVQRFQRDYPGRPVILALTGTDLYHDIRRSRRARRALEIASRVIVLQPEGVRELPRRLRGKVRVIYQSARVTAAPASRGRGIFRVCVLGHLRPVKDPLRAARAARLLPASSRIEVVHVGGALSRRMDLGARRESGANPRYRWLGEMPRWKALRVLMRSQVLVLSSRMEGGANVLSEAIAGSVPVLASRIPSTVAILGSGYAGYFPVADTRALAALLRRVETEPVFLEKLRRSCRRLKRLVDPARESRSWKSLLAELSVRRRGAGGVLERTA